MQAEKPPQNYLIPAILVTIFCCLPTGIVAIIYAAQVNAKFHGGDVKGARSSSESAKLWSIISAALVIVPLLIIVFFTLMDPASPEP